MAAEIDIRVNSIMPKLFEGWINAPFEQCIVEEVGGFKKLKQSSTKPSGRFPVVDQGEDLINGYIDDESLLFNGELPIIIFGDHTRRIKLIDFKFAVGADGTKILKPKDFLDFRFFYYYLNSLSIKSEGYSRHYKFLKSVDVPLPPPKEQQRIVAKLDELMEKIDRSRARLERIPKILKRFRQSILSAAVSGKLTEEWREKNEYENKLIVTNEYNINEDYKELNELPSNWKWVALGNYVKCNRGRFSIRPRNDPRYFGGDIPFIQIGDLPREGGLVNQHTQTLNNEGLKVSKMFPKNTVAIAIVGATIGNSGILNYNMCFTDSMVGIDTGDLAFNLFIDFYLRSEKENFRQLSYAGGGQPNIKLELLNAYPFPLPSIEEQKEIVRRVEQLFSLADKIEARYTKAKAQLDKLPQSLLAKAFRGELVPQDSTDEPASVLLERIKKEKSTPAGKTKKLKRYEMEEEKLSLAAED
jgi:type I restriction enzyme S subunit